MKDWWDTLERGWSEMEKFLGSIGLLLMAAGMCWALWPLTGILVFVPTGTIVLVRWRRRESGETPGLLVMILAQVSGLAVVLQIVVHGMPIALWLAAGVAGVIGAHLALRVTHGRACGFASGVLASARSSLIAVSAGIGLVVVLQVVLAYRTGPAPEQVKGWIVALGAVRARLEEALWLGPLVLGGLLLALIAIAVALSPSLRVVPSYRRIARAANLALLTVTAATSFTFFGTGQVGHWEGVWIARLERLDVELSNLDMYRREIIRLTALEDALRSLADDRRAELRELAAEIESYPAVDPRAERESREEIEAPHYGVRYLVVPGLHADPGDVRSTSRPDRERMWERVADVLAKKLSVEAIAERARRATTQLAPAPDPGEQAIERLRDRRDARLADLEVLGVERSRAQAARREVYAAVKELVVSLVIPRSSFADAFVKGVLIRLDRERAPRIQSFVDRRRVQGALHAASLPPPVRWQPEIAVVLGSLERAGRSDLRGVVAGVARDVRATAIQRAQESKARAQEAAVYHSSGAAGLERRGHASSGETGDGTSGRRFFRRR